MVSYLDHLTVYPYGLYLCLGSWTEATIKGVENRHFFGFNDLLYLIFDGRD